MHNLIKVEAEADLARDPRSKAIINTNVNGHVEYLEQRSRLLATKNQLEKNTNDISELKSEIGEVKNMLHAILEKLQK